MAVRWYSTVVDCQDVRAQALWWAEALGWQAVYEADDEVVLIDLAPHTSDDRNGEISRLLGMGATRVDVGQPATASWDVLADPEGNEFCVLSSRDV